MPQPLPGTIHDPATGGVIPASWGDAVNEFCEDRDTGPGARVTNSAAVSVPNTTWTTVPFDSERYDTENLHEAAINPSRLTVPAGKSGVYLVWFNAQFQNTGTNNEEGARIRLNGSTVVAWNHVRYAGYRYLMVAAICALAAGDYVEAQVYHDTGASNDLNAQGNYSPEFGMHRLGPSA
jgi:hypothetical protein